MADEPMRYTSGRDTGLARIVSHTWGHGMGGRVLLHRARMRRKRRRNNASHHPPRVSSIQRVDIDLGSTALSHTKSDHGSSVVEGHDDRQRDPRGVRAQQETRVYWQSRSAETCGAKKGEGDECDNGDGVASRWRERGLIRSIGGTIRFDRA